MYLEPFYIHVTPEESEIVQKLLFKCGYGWVEEPKFEVKHKDMPILTLNCEHEILFCSSSVRKNSGRRIITLEELITEIESKI